MIFFLDKDPHQTARFHVDRILARQILDVAQALQAAHIACDGEPTARNRVGNYVGVSRAIMAEPTVKWVRESDRNYEWTARLFGQLILEYELRNAKIHSYTALPDVFKQKPMLLRMGGVMTEFPLNAIPPRFQRAGDVVFTYRLCYFWMRRTLATWSPPAVTPVWWKQMESNETRAAS